MTKEKKKAITLVVILSVVAVLLIGCLIYFELRESGAIGSSESSEIVEQFNKVFNSKERQVIYYASSTCSYCEMQKPILETIASDYDVEYFDIDSNLLSNNDRKEILEALDIEHATPTTVIVEKGKVIDKQVGYTDGKGLISFLKEGEIIPENAIYSAEKYITFVDYDRYEELIDDDSKNIIVIGQTSCSACIAIKPALNSVAENYDLTINYLNLTELTEEERQNFSDSLEEIEYNDPDFVSEGKFGTPLTLIVKNGKVVDYISGARTISQLVREFTKAGLIEE